MINAIFQYEVKTWLKSPLFYVLVASFFLFSLVSMLGTGGYFDGPAEAGQQVNLLNSPYALCSIGFLFGKFLLFFVAIFSGFSLYRDYRNNTHAILYSFPISKSFYLNGKLGSVLFMLFLVSLLTILGIWVGEVMLGVDNPKIGANAALGYVLALGLYLLPTLIVIGIFVFVAVGISRNIYSGFIVVICFTLFQLIMENVFFGHREWLALLDPFGQNAFHLATRDWGFEQQNSNVWPVGQMVIWNRVLWLVISFSVFGFFYRKFDFQYDSVWQIKKSLSAREVFTESQSIHRDLESSIHYDFSFKSRVTACWQLMVHDFRSIAKNWMFILLCAFGAFTIFFIQLKVSNTGEFNLYPTTGLFVGAPLSIYILIIIFSTFIFSGLLINKARQYKMNLMLDASPVKDWQMILSKIGAISLLQIAQLLLFMVMGVAIQLINGYYNFEFGVYFFHLLILVFPILFVWNVTSQFVHSLIPNLFLGLFILAGIWMGAQSLEQIGLQTNLLKFNSIPALTYSDFNGYGHQLKGYFLLLGYWFLFGLLLIFTIPLIWNRGSLTSIKERFSLAKSRMSKLLLAVLITIVLAFSWLAYTIYSLEKIDQTANMASSSNFNLKAYKSDWGKFSDMTQPKITAIDLKINLYPQKASFNASGIYKLVNQSDAIMDTLFIRTGFDEMTNLDFGRSAQLVKEDAVMKSYLYKLSTSLPPGDSLELSFTIQNTPNTIFAQNSNVLANGSYIKQDILPRLGYQFVAHELPLADSMVHDYNYFHRDADYVQLHTVISTDQEQIAIAPGELISEKQEDGRNIYEYHSPKPIKFNFSFHSGRFEILEEVYKDVSIQLYYNKGHQRNTKLMLDGLKASLDYNTKWFGPYPYKEIRIIAFPLTEESYSATLTSNNIPASEILFKINSTAMDEKINLPYYVMAHELTHEWFGNQVMPADAEGAKMLTESITEYLSLCIYEANLGDEKADNFLKAQRNRYFRGRKREKGVEQPLNKVLSHQEYIAYGKGAIAFNALSESMGKEKFNSILQEYLLTYKSQSGYYPTTQNFIQLLKKNGSTEEHKLIDRWLTQVNSFE